MSLDGQKFVERLRSYLDEHGLSQAHVAAIAGLSKQTLSNWMTHKNSPSLNEAFRVARSLNLSLDWLTGLSDEGAAGPPPLTPRERALLEIMAAATSDPEGTAERLRQTSGGGRPANPEKAVPLDSGHASAKRIGRRSAATGKGAG